ncbi:FGGY-family carbohydrate kinase [Scatolibacter rhodanostii]|uniref:FGGY-family carbohydrate kinase n=1 Tax=Scatolibacter rhodanostii TaxID=2014781 RepID=UPI00241FA42C|nr:FGGY-family carbohydrate kinase [Scatolibacter rhodanostii]
MLPEYLNYRLTGIVKKEYTNASTTGMVSLASKTFDSMIIESLSLPNRLFTTLSYPGEIVGELSPEIAHAVGGHTTVKLCASHDTASAFESVDFDKDSMLLSSGTWSLLGLKSESGNVSNPSMNANFTNEGGVGYIRFLKNIMGLWIIGQLRKEYGLDYAETERLARLSDYKTSFDVNDSLFTAPTKMSTAIIKWFTEHKIAAPNETKDIISSAYHSIAASYKVAVDEIEAITHNTYERLYIIGGGANDNYLNALTTRYTKKNVIAMPIEATAIGNLKVQITTEV